jgi:hypothetical protein
MDLIVGAQRAHWQSLEQTATGIQRRYEDANTAYGRALQQVQAQLAEHYQAAYKSYAERVVGALTQTDRYERCVAAYRKYAEKLHQLVYQPNAAAEISGAQARLFEAHARLGEASNPSERARQALDAYATEINGILGQQQTRNEVKAAHAEYVEELNRLNEDWYRINEDAANRLIEAQKQAWESTGAADQAKKALQDYVANMGDTLTEAHVAVEKAAKAAADFVKQQAAPQ